VHIPATGNAAALTERAGGQVQMMFSNMLTAMPHVRSGRLRALAVSPGKRTPQAPDLPTVAESGVPGFDVTPWYGVLAPAGLPAPLVAKWNREIVRIVPLPDMREKFVAQGIDLASSTPAEFSALIKSEIPKWRKVVKDTGAKAD
jgi:tripartite-type tricarboxylate transporter receptor subunit TctC